MTLGRAECVTHWPRPAARRRHPKGSEAIRRHQEASGALGHGLQPVVRRAERRLAPEISQAGRGASAEKLGDHLDVRLKRGEGKGKGEGEGGGEEEEVREGGGRVVRRR